MTETIVDVRLVGLPVELWKRANAHQEAIQRELDLIKGDLPRTSVPHQLGELVEKLDSRFARFSDATWEELYRAAEEGTETVELAFSVPSEAAAAARQLGQMLDRVDQFCREGEQMVTLATPPDLVALRHWFLGEFERQAEQGLDPLPWNRYLEQSRDETPDTAPPGSEDPNRSKAQVVEFSGDLDLATAGDLRRKVMARRADGAANLLIDLTRVAFIDSVGLSVLVGVKARLAEEGASLGLRLPERMRRLFEITSLTELLAPDFVETPEPRGAPTAAEEA